MFDGRWRTGVDRGLEPLGSSLRRAGVRADQLTAAGLVFAALAAVAIADGRLLLGAFLVVASALPDMLDGAVAKASGTASPRGAFFDSVADRVSDALLLGAVAWHLTDRHGHAVVLAVAVLAVSTLISYERAKAESLGFTARGGLMERAERIAALVIALVFDVLVPILWVMLVLTSFTAVQRFVRVWRQASAPRTTERAPARWRSWRPAAWAGDSETGRWQGREAGSRARAWRRRVRTRP